MKLGYEDTIKKRCLKLIQRIVSSILTMKTNIDKIIGKANHFHLNQSEALNREIEKYEKSLRQILAIRRQNKYERDNIDIRDSNTPSLLNSSTENRNFRIENISSKVVSKEDLIKIVNIPSHEPLNLIEHQIVLHLSELLAKVHHSFQHLQVSIGILY